MATIPLPSPGPGAPSTSFAASLIAMTCKQLELEMPVRFFAVIHMRGVEAL